MVDITTVETLSDGDLITTVINDLGGAVEVVAVFEDLELGAYITYFYATTLTEAVTKAFTRRRREDRDYNLNALPKYLRDFPDPESAQLHIADAILEHYSRVVV